MSNVKKGAEQKGKRSTSKAKSPMPRPIPPKNIILKDGEFYDPKKH